MRGFKICHPASIKALSKWALLLVEVAGMASALAATRERLHVYTVSIDPALSAISVRACFDGKPPLYLVSESLDAAGSIDEVKAEGVRKRLEPNGAELKLGELSAGSCVSYRTDLTRASGAHERNGAPLRRAGTDLITELGIWFWRPQSLAADEDIEVRFDLPAGISASAPWRPVIAADGARAYRVGRSPYDWPAKVVFGRFEEMEIEVPGAVLRVALLDGSPAVEPDFVRQWLTRAAFAVTTLYGEFPVAQAQLVVVPGARGNEPVPWAYVLRGGAPSAHFFINQRRSLDEFMTDWTAVHELSHMLLPYIRPEDAWLSEGTASYYQNVLRARGGMISEGEAWQRLHSGFRRGMKSMPGLTLADATERMFRDGAFMRVYWEGAAMMLLADQRLRQRTGGEQSLDSALARLRECCLAPDAAWQARGLFDKLDELTGTTVFSELYEAHVKSTAFPRLAEAYRLLGLELDAEGESIRMVDAASQIAARDAIMRGPPDATN
jgi:hypothetical protein